LSVASRNGTKAYWAIKALNVDLKTAREWGYLQLNKLDELRLEAYESSCIYKEQIRIGTMIIS